MIAATEEMVKAEIEGRAALSSLLRAQIAETWPPQFYGVEAQTFTLQQLEGKPEQVGWWSWYIVLKGETEGGRILIGIGGFKGPPDAQANVEVGYSIVEEFHRRGYASEAVTGWVKWAFEQRAQSITAETLPELVASIRVMEKNGFSYVGAGSEQGVIRYRKERD
ncbi:hypothetical protein IAD21_01921 [Abditibacteriota bacterium]|nr:hypothetical protein IAD21_01921 [Abditibacteriota bacterium]